MRTNNLRPHSNAKEKPGYSVEFEQLPPFFRSVWEAVADAVIQAKPTPAHYSPYLDGKPKRPPPDPLLTTSEMKKR